MKTKEKFCFRRFLMRPISGGVAQGSLRATIEGTRKKKLPMRRIFASPSIKKDCHHDRRHDRQRVFALLCNSSRLQIFEVLVCMSEDFANQHFMSFFMFRCLEFLGFVLDFSSTKLYLICCSCRHFSYLLVHAQQFFAIFQLITNDFVWLLNGLVRNNVSIASSFDSSNSNLMNSSSHYTPTCDAIFSRLFKFSCFVIDAAVADFNRRSEVTLDCCRWWVEMKLI